MRASMILRSAQGGHKKSMVPSEVYPLLICMAAVTAAAGYRLYRNYMHEEVRAGHQNQDTARLPEQPHH